MWMLVLGMVIFLGVHSVSIVNRPARDRLVQRYGEPGWKGLYSVASLLGFALIIVGYAAARQQPVMLYQPPMAMRHVALLLLVPVFPLLVAAYLKGHLKRVTKHPMLLATKLWAAAHLLANGTAADLVLFGGFLAWAVADRISMKRRATSGAPFTPKLMHDLIAIAAGLGLYGWFVAHGHAWLIGVSPMGR